ncbi:MAG: hypothetical protein GY787_30415 [Alteromonadales bacterium]|nr:hypothetical protein [Alteromonadales bacterium]
MQINHCPVCGFKSDENYASVYELRCSYDICECCGCEYGYDDDIVFYDNWVKDGCIWFNPKIKPKDWSLKSQVASQIRPWPPSNAST